MRFVHVSDIHFDEHQVGAPDDPNLALRNEMVRDVRAMTARLGAADGIFLTGDIAFAGQAKEYEFALKWLTDDLCPAAGCDLDQVFSIPGNHDVARTEARRPLYKLARDRLRSLDGQSIDTAIRDAMRDEISAGLFFNPIENYNRFAASFLCEIGPYGTNSAGYPQLPHARRDLQFSDGSTLRLWGFNSVLISDVDDDRDRMLVDPAGAQIEAEDGVVHLVMCHHPFDWLRNGADFRSRIDRVARVHLFGHEHTLRFDDHRDFARIRSGALQPEREQPNWKPGYNWLELEVEGTDVNRILRVKVWTRQHEGGRFITLPAADGGDHWDREFKLEPWTAPPAVVDAEEIPVLLSPDPVASPVIPARPATSPSLRDLVRKVVALRVDQQRTLMDEFGFSEDAKTIPIHQMGAALVAKALEGAILDRLEQAVETARTLED